MRKIKVHLNDRSYPILIGSGVIKRLPDLIASRKVTGPVVLITDRIVAAKTARVTGPVFSRIPNDVLRIVVPSSERSKSLSVYRDTVQKISKRTKTHRPLIVAMGGGVVGDLGGFAAATFRRGVPYVQVPTTLLAQVDSSVGGKVGIDLPEAKNLIGAFYQPAAVIADTDLLRTLPVRQLRNGVAEIIKYGIIESRPFFELLEDKIDDCLALKKSVLEKVISKCLEIKARMVEKDERDSKNVRIVLNFGHTLGHAIEAAAGYSDLYNHGESIAVGMLLAGEIAMRLDMLKEKDFERMKALIKRAGLPVHVRDLSIKEILSSHEYDKKFITGTNRFVLPRRIGRVEVVEDIPGLLIKTVLKKYVG